MLQYRVLLAPLRYGAGLKGKVRGQHHHSAMQPLLLRE